MLEFISHIKMRGFWDEMKIIKSSDLINCHQLSVKNESLESNYWTVIGFRNHIINRPHKQSFF